jgi:hypothetical protein
LALDASKAAALTVVDAPDALPKYSNSQNALLLKSGCKRAGSAHSPCTVNTVPPADATMVGATSYTGAAPMKLTSGKRALNVGIEFVEGPLSCVEVNLQTYRTPILTRLLSVNKRGVLDDVPFTTAIEMAGNKSYADTLADSSVSHGELQCRTADTTPLRSRTTFPSTSTSDTAGRKAWSSEENTKEGGGWANCRVTHRSRSLVVAKPVLLHAKQAAMED